MKLDFDKVEQLITAGYIKREKHPVADLYVLNYTVKAQFDWHWTDETKQCRGLIVDGENNIIQRPFPKFFSAEQTPRSDLIWSKPFTVTGKMDGSLGILYDDGTGPAIATRGSFVSTQAQRATEILRAKYPDFTALFGATALFEIIFPENRIVCDYGDVADLYLLTVIDNETGTDAALTPQACAQLIGWDGPVAPQFAAECAPRDVLTALKVPDDGSVEGLVLRFDYPKGCHTRMKVKTDEYKRLHKILTGVSAKVIWESLRDGKPLDEILERTPDEFYAWVRKLETRLRGEYQAIEDQAATDYRKFDDRREAAEYFKSRPSSHILFAKMDGKDYSSYIWRMIQPKGERAFRCDIDI